MIQPVTRRGFGRFRRMADAAELVKVASDGELAALVSIGLNFGEQSRRVGAALVDALVEIGLVGVEFGDSMSRLEQQLVEACRVGETARCAVLYS